MTFHDWDELLKFCEVLTRWPPIVLCLAFMFRNAIAKKLASLESIKIKETEILFRKLRKVAETSSPELLKQFILTVRPAALTKGEPEADENDDAEEDSPAEGEIDDTNTEGDAEAERVQLEKILKDLQD